MGNPLNFIDISQAFRHKLTLLNRMKQRHEKVPLRPIDGLPHRSRDTGMGIHPYP